MGDLTRASRLDDVSTYRFKNYQFIENILTQHQAVSKITRLYDRVYLVSRCNMPDLTLVLIDAYEMSAEHLRNAYNRYGQFDVAYKTNSYGGITTAATEAANSLGVGAYMLKQLIARLYKP